MEYHNATKQVSVSFRNLQLKKIKRTEKKGTESVMDEKFSVLFWTEFTVRNPHSIELKVAFTHLTTMRVTKQSLKSREIFIYKMRRVLVKSRLLNGVNLANQKLSQNLEFEFVNFGIFHRFLAYQK